MELNNKAAAETTPADDNKSFAPIIHSFLDTDAYKLHMQQAVFHQFPDVRTDFEFNCRNKDDHLGCYADKIRAQVDHMRHVVLTDEEYEYLASLPQFKRDYLDYLRSYRYDPSQVSVRCVPPVLPPTSTFVASECAGDLVITVSGPWLEAILWEIPLLAIVSEVAQSARWPGVGAREAVAALDRRLDAFFSTRTKEQLRGFHVTDFGTRRRFSRAVQEAVVTHLREDKRFRRHLVGTSNFDLARRLQLPAVGTQAHEWFQAFQQLTMALQDSQKNALACWLKEYPHMLGIALTDCITMNAFLLDFNEDFANAYEGLRHDSGDPVQWGNKAIAHYRGLGIDPKTKLLVFSDGLNLDRAAELFETFKDSINVMCGIGTQLTCAIDGVRAMNIVLKMVRCQGRPVAKVSDSPGKTMCADSAYVVRLMDAFNVQSPVTQSVDEIAVAQQK